MKTRIRSFIMAMLLVLSLTATSMAAGTGSNAGITLYAEQASDQIVLYVYLTAKDSTNGRIVIDYDYEQLELVDVSSNDAWVTSVNTSNEGELSFAWVGSSTAASSKLMTLTFNLREKGPYSVDFYAEMAELYMSGVDVLGNKTISNYLNFSSSYMGSEGTNPLPPAEPHPGTPGQDEEVTVNPDGSVTTTVTDKDGNVTETTETTDGSSTTVVTDKDGNVTEVKADISVEAAASEIVTLPVEVEAAKDAKSAATVEISVPSSVDSVTVEIPVEDVNAGTVVVVVYPDGTEKILPAAAMTEDGLAITIDGDVTIKVVDNTKEFVDGAEQAWAEEAITFVTSRELFNGISEDTFGGKEKMTRAMLMTVLARLDGVDTTGGATWYEKGMEWAKANGISDGTNPGANISREQLATMLYRYAGEPATNGSLAAFTDADQVSGYAEAALKWAVEKGIINGMGDGTLNPKGEATRAQLAKILMYFINL